MKKRLNLIALIITTMPFAFSKMEGPFKGGTKENPYYFLYDKTTGYTIGYIPREEIPNNDIIRFFEGNPGLLYKNLRPTPQFYFTKEKPTLNLKEITELTELSKISRYFSHFLNKGIKFEDIQSPLITAIPLRQEFYTLSEVNVTNDKFGSIIRKNNSTQQLHNALVHKYTNNKNLKFAQRLSNQNMIANLQMFLDLQKTDLIIFDSDKADFLTHNHTAHLYAVIKNPYKKGSIFWGLGIEEKTSKKFHWMIELKDDLSTLTN